MHLCKSFWKFQSVVLLSCRRHPWQILGTRCCPCCIWWPWCASCRLTPSSFPGPMLMVTDREFLKVGVDQHKHTPETTSDCCWPSFYIVHYDGNTNSCDHEQRAGKPLLISSWRQLDIWTVQFIMYLHIFHLKEGLTPEDPRLWISEAQIAIYILNYAVSCFNFRRELPVDLAEGNLKALSLQGLSQVLNETLIYGLNRYSKVAIMFNIMLGMLWLQVNLDIQGLAGAIIHLKILQGVDMQLGLAIDNPKATLAVKRRLACEMIKCWKQVSYSNQMSSLNGCINLFFRIIISLLFVLFK